MGWLEIQGGSRRIIFSAVAAIAFCLALADQWLGGFTRAMTMLRLTAVGGIAGHRSLTISQRYLWLIVECERFRQLRLHALDEVVCILHGRAGLYAHAIEAGLASVLSEPTRELAHRALMTAHLGDGNRMEAIRQYHAYLAVARAEMGIGPSERLQRLFRTALEDAPDDRPMTPR